jgi:uncharacterized protein (DUF1697 family)
MDRSLPRRQDEPVPTYIAFLRAINVGGHTVKMDALRKEFEALGHLRVETFIASGNVIFESKAANTRALEQKIERRLRESLGYEVATFVRTPDELAKIVTYEPFSASELEGAVHGLYVGFVATPPTPDATRRLLDRATPTDLFHVQHREIYWLARQPMTVTPFSGAVLEKLIAMPATMRNITTIRKLAAKYSR